MQDTALWVSLLIGQGLLLGVLVYILVQVHRQAKTIRRLQDQQRLFDKACEKESE